MKKYLFWLLLAASPVAYGQAAQSCGNVQNFSSAAITTSGSTQLIAVPSVATAKVRICSFRIMISQAASPASFSLTSGTGTNCGTGTAQLTPPYPGLASIVQTVSHDYPDGLVFTAPAGRAVCLNLSAAATGAVVQILYTLSQGY